MSGAPCTPEWFLSNYPDGPPRLVVDLCGKAARESTDMAMRRDIGLRLPGQVGGFNGGGFTSRRTDKSIAGQLKIHGAGSSATGPRQSKVGDLGGAIGGTIGGERGGAIGTLIGETINTLFGDDRPSTGNVPVVTGFAPGPGVCPDGTVQMGSSCVDPSAALPGGAPLTSPVPGTALNPGGTPVAGAFGMAAMTPRVESRIRRSCGDGYVLGRDNLCYPKAVLTGRSKWRKWKKAPKPPITAAEAKMIRRAAALKDKVAALGRDTGLHVSKTRGKSRKQIENEIRLEFIDRD